MRIVSIYVENRRLDLFQDENIEVVSSVQNIADISLVFTDVSQTFTIPCSPTNNYIFEHYYNNDVDNAVDHNRRRAARIEIDDVPFKTGKLQIEKATVKHNNADSYTVNFFGDIVTFKDLVLEDKLRDLDYSSINHSYTGAEVQARIETDPTVTDYDVKYPLISSSRVWQYGDATSNDITSTSYPIGSSELFPAVRVASIFDLIETKYGVTFTGNILTNERFKNAFLWYKNKETSTVYSEPVDLAFGVGGTDVNVYDSVVHQFPVFPSTVIYAPYDSATNFVYYINVIIYTSATVDYYLDTYINEVYVSSSPGNGSQNFTIVNGASANVSKDYTFKLRAVSGMTISATSLVRYTLNYTLVDYAAGVPPLDVSEVHEELITTATTNDNTDLASFAPDMKVMDFIKGIFNTFNLTCIPTTSTSFKLQTLEDYYNSGADVDITEHTITDETNVGRPKLYNSIKFEYQQSQSFMNREYTDLFGKEYSNLNAVFGYDGGDYTIQLPFETLLHSKFTNTDLQVGYCLGTEPEYKNYVPKPVLLYQNVLTDIGSGVADFKFNNGTTVDSITSYVPFGQDTLISGVDYSLNFGSEISSFTLGIENNSLYETYYEGYLENLFNSKTRISTVKAILPLSKLSAINLNDTLIIRDKRYIINEMKSSLTTGEVEFTLITNNRPTLDYNQIIYIDSDLQSVPVSYSVPEGYSIAIDLPLETQFATPNTYAVSGEQIVTFSCTANTGAERTNTFGLNITTPNGVLPIQYLVIIQGQTQRYRIIETVLLAGSKRVTEDGEKRILE